MSLGHLAEPAAVSEHPTPFTLEHLKVAIGLAKFTTLPGKQRTVLFKIVRIFRTFGFVTTYADESSENDASVYVESSTLNLECVRAVFEAEETINIVSSAAKDAETESLEVSFGVVGS